MDTQGIEGISWMIAFTEVNPFNFPQQSPPILPTFIKKTANTTNDFLHRDLTTVVIWSVVQHTCLIVESLYLEYKYEASSLINAPKNDEPKTRD